MKHKKAVLISHRATWPRTQSTVGSLDLLPIPVRPILSVALEDLTWNRAPEEIP